MKKLTPGLLLILSVAVLAIAYHQKSEDLPVSSAGLQSGVTPEAKAAFDEVAAKADNQHWKDQEERLDKSAQRIQADTKAWMTSIEKSNPKATEDLINEHDDKMKKWEEENFGKKE